MPDWKAIVKAQLRGLPAEIVDELATHLEDFEGCLLAEGVPAAEAFERTRHELTNSPDLAKQIEQARGDQMNHRSKALWLPGLASFTVSAGSLCILQVIAMRTNWTLTSLATTGSTRMLGGAVLFPYFAWLVCQPLCGALGAWLSKRGGGRKLEFISSGVFPSLIMLAMMSLLLPIVIFGEKNPYILSHLGELAIAVFAWVGLPGLCLAIGTIPFWRSSGTQKMEPAQ